MNSKIFIAVVCIVLALFLFIPLVTRKPGDNPASSSSEQPLPNEKQEHTDTEYAKEFTNMLSQLEIIRDVSNDIRTTIDKNMGSVYVSSSNASMSRGIDGLCTALFEVAGLHARIASMEDGSEVICFEYKQLEKPGHVSYKVSPGDTINLERVAHDALKVAMDNYSFARVLYPVRTTPQGLTELDPDPLLYYQYKPFEAKQFVRSSKFAFMDEMQSISAQMREKGVKPA